MALGIGIGLVRLLSTFLQGTRAGSWEFYPACTKPVSRESFPLFYTGLRELMYLSRITGPEYISMVAAETEAPRKILPPAFRSFVWRILAFFVGSSLCMGIVIPYNDSTLLGILEGTVSGSGTGAAS
jgi:amino acid permease